MWAILFYCVVATTIEITTTIEIITLTIKSDKHRTTFPVRVKENVFGRYTISYPMFET